jgi:formylmethanofuran dehydrogenase subunit E
MSENKRLPGLFWCDGCGELVPVDYRPDPLDFLLCEACLEAALAQRQLMEQPL